MLMLLGGCDLFVLGPSLNLNYDDVEQGFIRFGVARVGKDEVQVGWDWLDTERKHRGIDPIYDKIIIQHSRGSYPVSRLGGQLIELKDWNPVSNPLWSTVFPDLKWDREHYFALYAHERDGRWMAPIYTSTYLGNYEENSLGFFWPRDDGTTIPLRINTSINEKVHLSMASWDMSAVRGHIFYYDLWEDEKVVSAILQFDVSNVTVDTPIRVFPMRAYWDINSGNTTALGIFGTESFTIDRSIYAEITVPPIAGTNTYTIDITDVFAKAQQLRTNGIILFTTGPAVDMEYGGNLPLIDLQVVRNYD